MYVLIFNRPVVAVLKRKREAANSSDASSSKKGDLMDTALVIKGQWCNEIFDNQKTWEIRGDPIQKRGRFAIAASGTGTLVGEATLVNCLRVGKYDEAKGLRPYSRKKRNEEI